MIRKLVKITLKVVIGAGIIIGVGFILLFVIYYYWGPIRPPFDWDYNDLGDGYKYYDEHGLITGGPSLGPGILHYTYDDNYIIASQDYRKECYIPPIEGIEEIPFESVDTDNDNIVYWILNKDTRKTVLRGTENELIEMCDSIGVPDALLSEFLQSAQDKYQ